MRVDAIWRYPVKSMLGDTVDTARLADDGIEADRYWALRDEERRGLRSGRQVHALTICHARYLSDVPGPVEITFPDGDTITTDDRDVHERLSRALGRPLTLHARRPADDLEHYRYGRPESDDPQTELRTMFGREPDEPLPDFSAFRPELKEFSSPPGQYYDCWPLMIMSTAALRTLQTALPDSAIDVRRFRPSLVIDTGDESGHPEFSWSGRRARLGTAEIELLAPTPRCALVTRSFGPDIPADRDVLRFIVRELNQTLGIYARVTRPGTIATGASFELL